MYLTVSLSTTGPVRALAGLACQVDRERFQPVFVYLGDDRCLDTPLGAQLRKAEIPTVRVACRGPYDFRVIQTLRRMLSEYKMTVLHSRLTRADFFARIAGRWAGTPLIINNLCGVYTDHFRQYHRPGVGLVLRMMNRITLNWAHIFVANSDSVRTDFIEATGVSCRRVYRIYNGVRIDANNDNVSARAAARSRMAWDADALIVGTHSRLVPSKDVPTFLKAAALVLQSITRARFVVIGDGPELPSLRKLCQELGLQDRVLFLGERNDAIELLYGIDVYVFPSLSEGHPNSLLEAMAVGVPPVGANVSGSSETIIDGESGYLVPPSDAVAFAARICELACDEDLRKRVGHEARSRVANRFNMSQMVQGFERIYSRSLDGLNKKSPLPWS